MCRVLVYTPQFAGVPLSFLLPTKRVSLKRDSPAYMVHFLASSQAEFHIAKSLRASPFASRFGRLASEALSSSHVRLGLRDECLV